MSTKQECMYMVKQLHDTIEKRVNQGLLEYDLTMLQMRALLILHNQKQDCCTMKEFEQLLHLAQSTTAGVVKRLEQKGYVQTVTDNQDRRIKKVQIMSEGIELCTYAAKEIEYIVDELFVNLTEEELQRLVFLVKKIVTVEP